MSIISVIVTIISFIVTHYLMLPASTISSTGFMLYISVNLCIFGITLLMIDKPYEQPPYHNLLVISATFMAAIIFLIMLSGMIIGAPLFQARRYADQISIETADVTMLPTVDDVSRIPLMDTASAAKLGDRQVGSLSDVVSQFKVSDRYYTIIYQDRVCKIAPLEYGGFFKYNNNKYNGIPGYVIIDTQTGQADYISLEKGYRISDSAYFGNNLKRVLRNRYSNLIFGETSFQIDEEGTPYWVVQVVKPFVCYSENKITGAVIMNAATGEADFYDDLNDIPKWVDYVVDGESALRYYNWKGDYTNGFWNSFFSQRGVTNTTDDFGYIAKDGDIWIYTGVTSINNDESNLGFLMVNSRNMAAYYVACDGAEEYSAMGAAQGAVQNYGYKASFPALVLFDGEPTYAMALKDENGLVRLYAFVNVKNYALVATGDTLENASAGYKKLVFGAPEDAKGTDNGDMPAPSVSGNTTEESLFYDTPKEASFLITVTIRDISFYDIDGNTYVYITPEDAGDINLSTCIFKCRLKDDEDILFAEKGSRITLYYDGFDAEDGGQNIIRALYAGFSFAD